MAIVSWASLPDTMSSSSSISGSSSVSSSSYYSWGGSDNTGGSYYSWGSSDNSGWTSNDSTDNSSSDSVSNQSGLGVNSGLLAYRLNSGGTFLFYGSSASFFGNGVKGLMANLFLVG